MICAYAQKYFKVRNTTHNESGDAAMAFKPPPLGEVLQQINEIVGDRGLKGEVDKNLRAVVQSALAKLDVVSREEFDTQTEILSRTRGQVLSLEAEIETLTQELESLNTN